MLILLKLEPEQALNLTDTVPLLDFGTKFRIAFTGHQNTGMSQVVKLAW